MIPFLDLRAQYRGIREEITEAISHVLESGQFVQGKAVAAFEVEFASFCQAATAVAVSSGTSALHLALLAAGVGPGDEVITVPSTFVATVAAIQYTGARPVLVDIEPGSYTMSPELAEKAITRRTKAMVPVHLYGQPADMDPLVALAERRGVVVIEDAAQAHGAEYQGRRAGSLGDLACFSFYPSKNLGAYGEAGMVTMRETRHAARIRMLRDWGQERRHEHIVPGYNYRMDEIQAAILRVKLQHLAEWIRARRERARWLDAVLEDCPIRTPAPVTGRRHVYHIYAVQAPERDVLRERLHARGVETAIHYPTPVHLQKAYADLGYRRGDFPCAEKLADETLSLPIYPELTETDVAVIGAAVRSALDLTDGGRPRRSTVAD